jgi:RNA polymerase sigma factor (sigma-70 family)
MKNRSTSEQSSEREREEDEILVERVLDGDPSAFEVLIARYKNLVYGIALNHLKDFHDAEDVCQETFLAAYRSLYRLEEPAKFSRWLYKIAKNQSLRWMRDHRKQDDIISWREISSEEITTLAFREESRRKLKQDLRDAVDSLSEKNRLVTILYYLSGYSYKEIAEFLGIKRSTVDSRLKESRKYLRGELASMVARELKSNRLPETTGGQSIQGITYGEDGKTPLQNASVFARQKIRRWRDKINLYFGPVWTDEQGLYKLSDLPIGDLEVRASAQNFEGISENVTLRSGECYTLNFSLRKAAIITGQIEIAEQAQAMFFRLEGDEYVGRGTVTPSPDGTYGIVLTSSADSAIDRGREIVEKTLPPSFMEQQGLVSFGAWQRAEAEEATGDLSLQVKGYQPVTISNLKIQRGKETKNVNIRPVHRTGSVSGRVLNEQGNPVAGVELGLAYIHLGGGYGLDLSLNRLVPVAISQEDGSFTLDDAIEGFHKIRPTLKTEATWASGHPAVALTRGQAVRDITVIVKPNPRVIVRGRIFEADGKTPMANAQLPVSYRIIGRGSGGGGGTLETDAEGRYEMRHLKGAATYEITVSAGDVSIAHEIESEDGARIEDFDFVMRKPEKPPALRGRLLSYHDKQPINGAATVEIRRKEQGYYTHVHWKPGGFEVAELEDGEYIVEVRMLHFSEFVPGNESKAEVNVVNGCGGEVTLYFRQGATISGRLLSATDGTLVQQHAEITRKGQNEQKFGHKCDISGGKFTFKGIPPGQHTFRVQASGCQPTERTIEVEFGQEISDLDFYLEHPEYEKFEAPLGAISGVVTLPDGKTSIAGALVVLFKGQPYDVVENFTYKAADNYGRFLIEALPTITYTLFVIAPGFPTQKRTVEVKAGEPTPEVKIRFVKGGTIQGRLIFPPGMTIPANLLIIMGYEELSDRIFPDAIARLGGSYDLPVFQDFLQTDQFETRPLEDGSFEVKNVPPGRYAVILFDRENKKRIPDAMLQSVEVKSNETTTVELHIKEC